MNNVQCLIYPKTQPTNHEKTIFFLNICCGWRMNTYDIMFALIRTVNAMIVRLADDWVTRNGFSRHAVMAASLRMISMRHEQLQQSEGTSKGWSVVSGRQELQWAGTLSVEVEFGCKLESNPQTTGLPANLARVRFQARLTADRWDRYGLARVRFDCELARV